MKLKCTESTQSNSVSPRIKLDPGISMNTDQLHCVVKEVVGKASAGQQAQCRTMLKRRVLGLFAAIGTAALLFGPTPASAQTVNLGNATPFGALAGSTVTNTGPTNVTGDVGVSTGSAITGFPPGTLTGTQRSNDAVAIAGQTALTTAYNAAAAAVCNTDLTGQDLGGLTLTPGVYCFSSSAQLTGNLALNFQGNPNAEFLFQIGSTLTTASASLVTAINTGGTTCMPNVNWQVGSSATLGTTSNISGNILAQSSITLNTNANLEGRALARTGAVTLDSNAIVGGCPFAAGGIGGIGGGGGGGAGSGTVAAIPTLSEWAMILLAGLLAIGAFAATRRKRT